jgi:two-component system CheB/CheR fusion protein
MSFHDVTERKQLESSLIASENQFRGIAEQSPVLIWRAEVDGECDYCNRTWCDFRGRSPEQERGEGWTEGVHPEDLESCRDAIRGAIERPGPFELTFRLLRHDGVYRWVHARGAPYSDHLGSVRGLLVSCVDITERVELEAALDEQRQLAEEASRHKTRLLSALSHDARTPLNAVVLAAELLEMHVRPDADPEVEDCLRTIRHSVGNVLELLGDLLNLTKIDAGVLPAEISRFELVPVLEESIASIETQARVKGLDVRLEPGPLAGVALETDRSKLKQILCNLLSNALRYTDRGHIRVYGARTEDEIRIAVEDTGIGIDPADHDRVFDEFATLTSSRRQAGEGTGLGLAICRRLASLLRGEITLTSAPGVGSTFTIVLPASVLSAAARPADVADAPAAGSPDSAPIVVAEDHLTSRQTLARVLRRMGYHVLEAGNGRDALALIAQERPLAVLMDINMPVMDGVEATRDLRADPRTRDLPIFALTGDVSVVNQRRIGEAGVDGYLEKPVTIEALRQALGSIRR